MADDERHVHKVPERVRGYLQPCITLNMLNTLHYYLYTHPQLLYALSALEDQLLRNRLCEISIHAPIYVTGLARSGTTLVTEFIAKHDGITSHQYRDFPFLHIPYFRSKLSFPIRRAVPQERAHQDRMMVSPTSPESFEEIFWAHFIADLHNPQQPSAIGASASHPAFEAFYRTHIQKLLLARKASRYLAKANYNLTRIPYIRVLFADAKFIIMQRDCEGFVASCLKQDQLFCQQQQHNPNQLLHTNMTQHFEFGLNKRPINFGNSEETLTISRLIHSSARHDQIEGWARYWKEGQRYVTSLLANPDIAASLCLISYNELCTSPETTLQHIGDFLQLDRDTDILQQAAQSIAYPSYYRPDFSDEERSLMRQITV